MASFLLKINCILPVLKTKKTLFTHFQQYVLSFNSWSMLLKSKDNTVVAKQQSAEMLNIYKVLFSLNLQTALHTPLVDTRSSQRSTADIAEIPTLSLWRADALWQHSSPAQPPRQAHGDPGTLSQYTRFLPRLPGESKRQLDQNTTDIKPHDLHLWLADT